MSLKLLLEFGSLYKRDVVWHKELTQFPKVFTYKNTTWEWVMWDSDHSGTYDYKLLLSPLKNYLAPAGPHGIPLPVPDLDEMFGSVYAKKEECECGATYDRHFPNAHSRWCKAWKKL